MGRWQRWATALLFLLLSVEITLGTTWENVTDETIIDQADVIAEVVVEDVRPITSTEVDSGAVRALTLYTLRVTKWHAGHQRNDLLQVSEPGGGPMVLPGMPRYEEGQSYLVFLSEPDEGGVRRTIQQELGAVPTDPPAADGLGAPMRLVPEGDDAPDTLHNRLRKRFGLPAVGPKPQSFGEWLGGMFSSAPLAAPRYMLPMARWRFDSPVPVKRPSQPPEGLTLAQADAYVDEVVAAWNANSSIRFEVAPTRSSGKGPGFVCEPGAVNLSWDDPRGEISDPVNGSGALAVGGFCGAAGPSPDGFTDLIAGGVVYNNGWSHFWTMTEGSHFVEVLTHEVGHTLVFAHSAESGEGADDEQRDATMSWIAHFDGRRAALKSYDQRAKDSLYALAPTPVETEGPRPTDTEAPAPTSTTIGGGGKGCGKKKPQPTSKPE